MSVTKIAVLTFLTMYMFAGSSVLCRIALKHTSIAAASFTSIRLISGAVALGGIMLLGELLTVRFVLASLAISGGIALVILSKSKPVER